MRRLGQGAVYLLFRFLLLFLGIAVYIPGVRPFLVWVLGRVLSYRKNVVLGNLALAFPAVSVGAVDEIAAGFYGHFVNLLMEHAMGRKKSEAEWKESVGFEPENLLEKYAGRGESCFVVMGHTGNWEWAGLRASFVKGLTMAAVYKPQRNVYIQSFLLRERSRFGMQQVAMNEVVRYIHTVATPFCMTFIADQSGPRDSAFYPLFFGVRTSFFGGWAKIALRNGIPVLYAGSKCCGIHKYSIEFKSLWDGKGSMDAEGLVQKFACYLEEEIKGQPETWLWSHRRWKWRK
jgi:Kdo2-lipid IVA lauroyltransferase/acyltransferase